LATRIEKFVLLLVSVFLDIMWTHLHSCVDIRASAWLLTRPTTPSFHLSLAHFLTTLHPHLGLPHFIVAHLSRCHCGHTIDDLSTHLFWCLYRSECTTTHSTLWDIVIAFALESGAHV
jgi:hypothetical protein